MCQFMRMKRFAMGAALVMWAVGVAETAAGDWKSEANERIEQLRKGDAEIVVVDGSGSRVAGAKVSVKQVSKAFPFGAAINGSLLRNEQYQKFFLDHFNYAVFENESKWYANEGAQGRENYRTADALLDWCEGHGIPVRGHCVFWAPQKWQPRWVQSLEGQELRAAVERRLVSAVEHFKGRFVSWDVNNEMVHGTFYEDKIGEDIRPWMFKETKRLDPSAKLFVNEYNILSVDENFQEVELEEYVRQTRELMAAGAPIEGVGVQGHIWHDDILSKPGVIKERLDRVAELGLPIWISEFDTANDDEEVNAENLELIYRTAYSHPAVEGVITWVVWSERSWRGPNAGLAKADWSLNAAGRRYEALMEEWTTRETGVTDGEGKMALRGFHGE